MNPVLQPLTSRHREAVSDLLKGSGRRGDPATAHHSFDDWSDDPVSPAVCWMAGVYVADELAGFLQVRDSGFEGQLEATLFVDAKWRRQGLGTLLLKATLDWASLRRASMLRLVCARTDWPMRHFARKFGARLDLVLGQLVADFPLGPHFHEQPRVVEAAIEARH